MGKRVKEPEKSSFFERYQKLYDENPRLRVIEANREGNLSLLKETFFIKKELNILEVTPSDKWNWLHSCNFNPRSPAPLSVMKFYIQHKVPINAQDAYGMTPLHYALESDNIDGAIALLEAGANPNLPNKRRITPLAYINGFPERLDLLQLMLDNGGDVNFFNGHNGILEGIKKYRAQDPRFTPVIELMEKYSTRKSEPKGVIETICGYLFPSKKR